MKVIFLDEAIFTYNTFYKRAWSSAYSNIKVQEKALKIKTFAMISGISEDGALEAYAVHAKSIKAEQFKAFLK